MWRARSALVLAVLLGVGVRLWAVAQSGWRIDYDEAMMGLVARGVLEGDLPVFIPAQPTLGAHEAYLLAPLFAVFGANAMTFRAVSLLIAGGYVLSVGLLAWEAFGPRIGVLTALVAALAPPYLLASGLKTWGGTAGTLTLGQITLLLAARAFRATDARGWLAAAGFVAGLLFWLAWLGFYYFIPAAIVGLGWLIGRWRERRTFEAVAWGVTAFAIGSAPFWLYNAAHGWPTFVEALGGELLTRAEVLAVFAHFHSDLLLRLASGDPAWGGIGRAGRWLAASVYVAGWFALLAKAVAKKNAAAWMLAGVALTIPAIYFGSSYARNALNPFGVDATGRYVVMLHSVLPIGIALLTDFRGLAKGLGGCAVAIVLALNLTGIALTDHVRMFDSPYYDRLPVSLTPLIDYLQVNDIEYVWTDVGIAQPLMFATEETIIAADYWDIAIAGGLVRFPAAFDAVYAAALRGDRVAYIVPVNSEHPPLQQALDAVEIGYDEDRVGDVAIYTPHEALDPATIAAGLGYQY